MCLKALTPRRGGHLLSPTFQALRASWGRWKLRYVTQGICRAQLSMPALTTNDPHTPSLLSFTNITTNDYERERAPSDQANRQSRQKSLTRLQESPHRLAARNSRPLQLTSSLPLFPPTPPCNHQKSTAGQKSFRATAWRSGGV